MRNSAILLILACTGILLVGMLIAFRAIGRPRPTAPANDAALHVDATIDLGGVASDELLQVPVHIVNRTNEVRTIGQFTTSCTCISVYQLADSTKVKLLELAFRPNESKTVYADIKIGGEVGKRQATTIGFKDISNGQIAKPYYATNIVFAPTTAVFTVPQNANLGIIRPGAQASQRLELRSNGGYKDSLDQLKRTCTRGIQVGLHQSSQEVRREFAQAMDGQELVAYIDITGGPFVDSGRSGGEVALEYQGRRLLTIPVSWNVLPEYVGLASQLVLPRYSNGPPEYSTTLRCRSRSGRPFQITARNVPDVLHVDVKQVDQPNGSETVVLLEYTGDKPLRVPVVYHLTLSIRGEASTSEFVVSVSVLPEL